MDFICCSREKRKATINVECQYISYGDRRLPFFAWTADKVHHTDAQFYPLHDRRLLFFSWTADKVHHTDAQFYPLQIANNVKNWYNLFIL